MGEAIADRGGPWTTGTLGDDKGLLTEQDAAELLEVALSRLRRWQREGTGPPCLEIGRQVRYPRARGVSEVDRLPCCAFVFVDEAAEDVMAVELPRCG
jgi:hypothetical protein